MITDGLITFKKYFFKNLILSYIKRRNNKYRKKIGKMFREQFNIEWGIDPVPEWFDHYIDLYFTWGVNNQNVFWIERGSYNLLAIKENSNLLELCCGDGFNSKYFYSHKAKKIIAVDFDPNAIMHAKKFNHSDNIDFRLCDIKETIPQGQFDNIIWDAAIEHFTEEEINIIMREIKNKIK